MQKTVYIIVRFKVEAEAADNLIGLISDFFKNEVSLVPGFISAKLHMNEEKTVIINYATWESIDRFKSFMYDIATKSERSKKIRLFNPSTDIVFEAAL